MIDSGQFRQDLMYRINTIQLHIPPLRERVEDIDELALFYVAHYAKKYAKEGITISEEAINKLKRYAWPGNIRELQHTIEKAVILTDSDVLGTADFMFAHDDGTLPGRTETLEEMEKRVILTALRKNNLNQSVTADQLGITRQTLYNKLKKYGI
jgi:DNA-binding NtrC family response regulator